MKKISIKFFLIIIVALAVSCQTTSSLTRVNEAFGKEWKLIEVQVNKKTEYTRILGKDEKLGEVFSIKIDAESVSGVGAPNRYSAPYTVSEDNPINVKIAVVRSTLMAPINQPEKLKEHDFFNYIQNTYKWGLSGDKLELHSKTNNGISVVMIFSL